MIEIMTEQRWQSVMQHLGIAQNPETYYALLDAYSEKHRRYHTGEHIEAMLKHLDRVQNLANEACEVEIALWFHDAIYQPFSATNELDSANWATEFLSSNGVPQERIDRVYQLIMATVHNTQAKDNDALLLVDIDLSILGAQQATYSQFEKDVRYEYRLVPYFLYRKERKKILASFLERDRLYHHDFFYEKLEKQARINLANAIEML